MELIKLYRYTRPDGGIDVSPIIPNTDYTELVRIVADEGKMLTQDGENFTGCIDTDSAEGWHEVAEAEYEAIMAKEEEAVE